MTSFSFGIAHAVATAQRALTHRVGVCADGAEILVRGTVVGLVTASPQQSRFDVRLDTPATLRHCTRAPIRRSTRHVVFNDARRTGRNVGPDRPQLEPQGPRFSPVRRASLNTTWHVSAGSVLACNRRNVAGCRDEHRTGIAAVMPSRVRSRCRARGSRPASAHTPTRCVSARCAVATACAMPNENDVTHKSATQRRRRRSTAQPHEEQNDQRTKRDPSGQPLIRQSVEQCDRYHTETEEDRRDDRGPCRRTMHNQRPIDQAQCAVRTIAATCVCTATSLSYAT